MATDDQKASLAEALREPLREGSLEAALQAARGFFMRHPGDDAAKRVVEALELFMSQVWFGGAEEGGVDPRYVTAAQHLERVELESALALYEAIASESSAESARRLALRVRVVMAARAGAELPASEHVPVPAAPVFDDAAPLADEGELPAGAFEGVTAGGVAEIPPEAYPDEPTRTLMAGDYELFDDPGADEERTRIHPGSEPKPKPVRRTIQGSPDDREVTRVASEGELPLDELRKEMESQADSDLDEMLGSMPPREPNREASLVLDITLDGLDAAESPVIVGAYEPQAGPVVPAPPVVSAPLVDEPAPVAPVARTSPRVPAQTEARIPRPGPPRISLRAGFVPVPSVPAPTEPPLPRAPEPVSAGPAPAPLAPPSVPPSTPPSTPPSVPPRRSFRPIVKDAPRSALPSVPPPVVRAPEIAPRGSVPPAAPKPAPAAREVPFPLRPEERRSSAPPAPAVLPAEPVRSSAPPPAPPPVGVPPAPPADFERSSAPPAPVGVPTPAATTAAGPRGPVVPAPSAAPRGPAVPPPPSVPELMLDGPHGPVDTGEIALPSENAWTVREPGALGDDAPVLGEPSWVGVRADEPPAFEPVAAPIEADTWDEPTAATPVSSSSEDAAEAFVARGQLGEALRMYQELALAHPERPELWERVAEIARLLQQRQP